MYQCQYAFCISNFLAIFKSNRGFKDNITVCQSSTLRKLLSLELILRKRKIHFLSLVYMWFVTVTLRFNVEIFFLIIVSRCVFCQTISLQDVKHVHGQNQYFSVSCEYNLHHGITCSCWLWWLTYRTGFSVQDHYGLLGGSYCLRVCVFSRYNRNVYLHPGMNPTSICKNTY